MPDAVINWKMQISCAPQPRLREAARPRAVHGRRGRRVGRRRSRGRRRARRDGGVGAVSQRGRAARRGEALWESAKLSDKGKRRAAINLVQIDM